MVLDEGRIQELGSHDELLARRGSYWRAARLQLTGVAPIPECIKI
jgi:ABC-type multidrug transport system fused ATPase/permease subunit